MSIRCPRRLIVMRGLDPRIHPLTQTMDRRVKPGDDDGGV
jgi:hypothetical protein